MRLLHTSKLKVQDVPDDRIPPYAVLSHTWGHDEVTFQDVRDLNGHRSKEVRAKVGFDKLKDAAALAHDRGFSWIWIDTCCIDKTSSAELSEAINSMYRWYEEAHECYAYLFDVEHILDDPEKVAVKFADARWFKRGWTLQELIAPHEVRFYNQQWTYLGSKGGTQNLNMPSVLSRITGIDRGVLAGHMHPGDLSVASRMQWAAGRRTTRTEDLAYCLMGLFDVNMPLLYGEGHKAFIRLQEEIIKVTDDQSIFAWASLEHKGATSSEDICGLLATSAKQFRNIQSMNPLPPLLGRQSVPSDLTNQGLKVQLQLRPVAEVEGINQADALPEEYVAILDCSVTTGVSHFWPALHLQRLWNDQFARVRPHLCQYLPAPAVAGSEYQVVYVKQKPKHVIPELYVPTPHLDDGTVFMDLEEVHPTTRWNPYSMTLKSIYSAENGVMGAFRFRHAGTCQDTVDVLVGIRPSAFQLKTRQVTWEAWCFQRRGNGQKLHEVFDVWDRELLKDAQFFSRPGLVEYQSMYGEDDRLLSSAAVVEATMYGRPFFSVTVTMRQELHIQADLAPSDGSLFSHGAEPEDLELEMAASRLVGPCFTSNVTQAERDGVQKGVRVRERYNVNCLPLVTGLKAHPTKDSDSAKWKTNDIVRFTRSLASISLSTETLNTKLLAACRRGDAGRVHDLIKRGANVNACTDNVPSHPWDFSVEGLTPLHWAIITKSDAIITELLHEEANMMAQSTDNWNVLHLLAILYDKDKALPKALTERLSVLPPGELILMAGEKVKRMLETPLHMLAGRTNGNTELIDIMAVISDGFQETGGHALSSFSSRNHLGELPVHRAAASNNFNVVRYYTQRVVADADTNGILDTQDDELRTPLWHAAGAGAIESLRLLLSAGASPNLGDSMGRTPLHIATREGSADAVKILLEYGAYTASPAGVIGLTPYHFGALFGHERCLRLLVDAAISPKSPFEILTSAVFDVPTTDPLCSFTPLHLAAANGWLAGVSMLVVAGASVWKRSTHYIRRVSVATIPEDVSEWSESRKGSVGGNMEDVSVVMSVETSGDGWERRKFLDRPRLVEEPSRSVPGLVAQVMQSEDVFPELKIQLAEVLEYLHKLGLSKPKEEPMSTASTRPQTARTTTDGGDRMMSSGLLPVMEMQQAPPMPSMISQQGVQQGQQAVVDLSTYDGGLDLDLPTPGIAGVEKKVEKQGMSFGLRPSGAFG